MNEVLMGALRNWRSLNHNMHALKEDEVKAMLEHELKHQRRPEIVERLHARYNSLRVQRERIELLGSLV